jgi:hypothetical protein
MSSSGTRHRGRGGERGEGKRRGAGRGTNNPQDTQTIPDEYPQVLRMENGSKHHHHVETEVVAVTVALVVVVEVVIDGNQLQDLVNHF